jgi:hypothetical protein
MFHMKQSEWEFPNRTDVDRLDEPMAVWSQAGDDLSDVTFDGFRSGVDFFPQRVSVDVFADFAFVVKQRKGKANVRSRLPRNWEWA